MTDPEDRALVARYLTRRDEAAFRDLYRRHTPALWGIVLRLVGGDDEAAREVVQETWVRAASGLAAFRWESRLATWLTGIALNCAREARRQPHAVPITREAEIPAPLGEGIDLARAIDALPEGYRQVLVLHDVEGRTHEEIGGLLGIEAGTSKSQLHHARRRMRALLRGERGGVA